MKENILILKKCLLNVIMFAAYFQNGSEKRSGDWGRERNKVNVAKC